MKIKVDELKILLRYGADLSRNKIQKILKISEPAARAYKTILENADLLKTDLGEQPEVEQKETLFKQNKNVADVSGQAYSLEDLLEKAEVDLEVWEVDTWEIKDNSWDVTMKDKDKNPQTTTNKQFYIKARLKRRTDLTSTKKFKREIIDEVKNYSPEVKKIHHNVKVKGNLLEFNIPDLHLGKLSWPEETDYNYNIKIAVRRFEEAVDFEIQKATAEHEIEQILFIVGNDLFNSDQAYPYAMTTKGTPQQDDTRWQKSFREGRKMIYRVIERFKRIAPVHIIVIYGNHDFQKVWYLGEVLEAKYENDPNVTVDNRPKTRKYFAWGRCLLGFAHGNGKDEGIQRLFNNMTVEAPRQLDIDWSKMLYKEWHCGDIHHLKEVKSKGTNKAVDLYAEDIEGIIIRYFPTLMFNDEWEAKKGFVSQKGSMCFVWNKEDGNTAIYRYNRYD
jgi:hypothetical protein